MTADVAFDVIDVALRVATSLEAVGAQYFIGGSLASSLQGEPRATNDIDFVIDMPAGRVQAFHEALGDDFELDTSMLLDAVLHARTANAFYLPFVTKIDFFGRAYEPFDDSEFARRSSVVVRNTGESLVIKSPEDTVLRKLLWYRAGGEVSDRQWRDVLAVLRINNASLDTAYLARWASQLKVTDLLERARR